MANTKTSALTALTGALTATGDLVLILDVSDTSQGAGGTMKTMTRAEARGAFSPSIAIISDTKAAGTDGGTFTSGAWRTRDLNTEDSDPDGIVSITSNQFTLQAGSYLIAAEVTAHDCGHHTSQIYNITDTATELISLVGYLDPGDTIVGTSTLEGVVTITSAKVFEVQGRCTVTKATTGMGAGSALSWQSCVYTRVKITKLAEG